MKIMDSNPILSACFAFCVAAFSHGSIPGHLTAPINTTPSAITGTLTVGQTITASTGAWQECIPSCTYTYQFYNEGSAIGGATCTAVAGSCNYTLAASDLGARISVSNFATNSIGSGAAALSAVSNPVISTTAFYVANAGNDSWDGTSPTIGAPHGPWATLAHVNTRTSGQLPAGSSVLLNRGDVWREQLNPGVSGSAGNPIVIDAYGTGVAPSILGSVAAVATGNWDNISGNKWKSHTTFPPISSPAITFSGSPGNVVVTFSGGSPSTPKDGRGIVFYTTGTLPTGLTLGQGYWLINSSGSTANLSAVAPTLPCPCTGQVTISSAGSGTHHGGVNGYPSNNANDIGNLIFTNAGTTQTGTMLRYDLGQNDANLTTQGQWYFSIADWKVHVYSVGNPATAMPSLELAVDRVAAYITTNYIIIQNINIANAGASGMMFHASTNDTARDMTISYAGGASENGDPIRFGNGMDIELTGSNHMVERLNVIQPYDAGLTIEPLGAGNPNSNITFRNNILQSGPQGSIQLLTGGAQLDTINILNNTTYNAAGWSENQRWGLWVPPTTPPSESGQRYGLYTAGATPVPTNYVVKNNAITGLGTSCSINGTAGHLTMWQAAGPSGVAPYDYNLWSRQALTTPQYCAGLGDGNVSIATWAAGDTPAEEVHGSTTGVDPLYTSASTGNFTPQAGSPLKSAGVNLSASGVVWDFNRNPRPAAGNFTIGAIQ